ncbi:MAG TPA: hypothetical protein VNA14_08760 [Mycobacteriales bacterium]|nr:hypothetical protein [Mycobacteriales bacterium]
MRDALKNYLALANGLTEVTRQRAEVAAKALVAQGEAAAEQVSALAEDLLSASKSNRDNVTALVRTEVEKALSRVGVATADELARLQRRLQTVEATMRGVGATTTAFATTAVGKARRTGPAGRKPAAKKPAGNPAASRPAKPAAKKPAAKPAASRPAKPAVKKSAVKKPAVKKPTVKKPTVKKPTVKKPAKKAGS